jgi:hypothetical protein
VDSDINWRELYVPLNCYQVLAWDVNPVGMSAVLIVAHPMPFNSSSFQLGPRDSVHPHTLPPLRHASQIQLVTVEPFIWCDVAKDPRRRAVLEPSCVVDGLPPKVLGESAVVQYCANVFDKASVERLSHPVVLWDIMSGEPPFRTLLAEKLAELSASVLPFSVRMEPLDLHAVLSKSPGHKVLVSL